MRRGLMVGVCGLGLVALAPDPVAGQGTAAAPQARDAQSVRVGATIFYDYVYDQAPKRTDADGNEVSLHAFSVKRAYINITGNISRIVSFRVTPDVRRETGTGSSLNGSLTLRLKYAYAQFALDDWMPAGTQVRLGVIQTPFIDSQEGVYRYRFQGTVFAERDGGLSSADAGVSLRTPLPNDHGDVQVALYNGEGYTKDEANDQKSLQLRATFRPLARSEGVLRGLRVTAFYNGDHYQKGAERRRVIASAMFEHRRLNAGVDVMLGADRPSVRVAAVDSRGYSVFVTPFFDEKGSGWEGLLRLDRWDADVDTDGVRRRLIVGGAYWFPHPGGSATAALLFDLEQVTFHGFATPQTTERRFAVHGLINF